MRRGMLGQLTGASAHFSPCGHLAGSLRATRMLLAALALTCLSPWRASPPFVFLLIHIRLPPQSHTCVNFLPRSQVCPSLKMGGGSLIAGDETVYDLTRAGVSSRVREKVKLFCHPGHQTRDPGTASAFRLQNKGLLCKCLFLSESVETSQTQHFQRACGNV